MIALMKEFVMLDVRPVMDTASGIRNSRSTASGSTAIDQLY